MHEQARQEKGIYLNVLNPWVWTGLIVAVLLGGPKQTHEYVTLCGLSTLMCTLSLLPSLLAYPIISALGVSLVTVPFLLLSLFALFVQAVLARVLSVTRWPLNDRSLERHSTA